MSGHVRFEFAALILVAVFSTPAASNPLTDLLTPNPPPEAAAPAPAPAQDACAPRPGPAAPGGHWVYRYDGHRKCWFQAEAGGALSKRAARPHATRQRPAAAEEDESEPRSQKAVDNARAEMVNAAPAETPQPVPSEPTLKIVRTIPVGLADAAAQVPPPPARDGQSVDQQAADQPNPDQLKSDQAAPRRANVEQLLLADAPAAREQAASAPPTLIAAPIANMVGGREATASWLGALLITLGGVALLIASLRRVLWPARSPDSGTDRSVIAQHDRYDPSFRQRVPSDDARRDELLHYDPQSVAPLGHAARTRRPVAPEPPSQEALWEQGMDALAALGGASPEVFRGRRAVGYRGVE